MKLGANVYIRPEMNHNDSTLGQMLEQSYDENTKEKNGNIPHNSYIILILYFLYFFTLCKYLYECILIFAHMNRCTKRRNTPNAFQQISNSF